MGVSAGIIKGSPPKKSVKLPVASLWLAFVFKIRMHKKFMRTHKFRHIYNQSTSFWNVGIP